MDKYRLVGERKSDALAEATAAAGVPEGGEVSEVRITQQGKPRNYITYTMNLFDQKDQIILKAMGRAINKCVTIAEILKRKMPLHQITSLSSSEIIDVFEPLEEGLDVVESRRFVSCLVITLSKTGEGMDKNDIGYQMPLPPEEIQPGDLNAKAAETAAAAAAAAGAGGTTGSSSRGGGSGSGGGGGRGAQSTVAT